MAYDQKKCMLIQSQGLLKSDPKCSHIFSSLSKLQQWNNCKQLIDGAEGYIQVADLI